MTIGELIGLQETHPIDMRLVVDGYEEGYDDLSPEQVSAVGILLNTGTEAWQGRHGGPRDLSERPQNLAGAADALVIGCISN